MIKIGIYLGAHPQSGGAFQYSHAMLRAVELLPPDQFDSIGVAAHPAWPSLASGRLSIQCFPYSPAYLVHDHALRWAGAPASLWRRVAPSLGALGRALARERDRLWLFPAEDSLSYQLPLRSVVTIFDLMHRYEPRFPEVTIRGRGWRRDVHYRRICAYAEGVLVDSEIGRRQLVSNFSIPPERVHVFPYGVPPHIADAPPASDDLPASLPPKYFFYPAQFWLHKNHATLIEALRRCAGAAPDMTLVLAGADRNAMSLVQQQITAHNLSSRVLVLGFVPDRQMPALYRRARALILPSYFGPTNIPPLEAMTLGCPVACSDVYAAREQLGDAALFFDPASAGEMAQTMLRLWREDALCAELRARGYVRAAAARPQAQAQVLAALLRRVAASR